MASEEHRRIQVAVPDWWQPYKPFRAMAVPTSPMYMYLGHEFVERGEKSCWQSGRTCIVLLSSINV